MKGGTDSTRRALLGAVAALPLAACTRAQRPHFDGAWLGAAHELGHRLRDLSTASDRASPPARSAPRGADVSRRAGVIVVGAGIAGLAATRALMRAGIDDVHVFELEDAAGGNSRGHVMGGMACPLGAHYLPLPSPEALEVAEWLDELGVRRLVGGQPVFDERQLCHAPQERLFIAGQWVDGLLPPLDALPSAERGETQRQYFQFHAAVMAAAKGQVFCVPTARSRASAATAALDRLSFADWLGAEALNAPALRWYLDYCCRDDFGAGAAFISAWAGLHYFASRHGFHAPGADSEERGAVLTWPEGNAWLAKRLATGLRDRLHLGQVALRVRESRHDVQVDLLNSASQSLDTWTARHVVLAVPLFVAARLCEVAPSALDPAATSLHHAPWLVANLHLAEPLADRGGAPPAWDNVMMDSPTLGYVDAMHQSTRAHPGATVLTAYWALGGQSPHELRSQRMRLRNEPWSFWADAVVRELAGPHPDIATRIVRIDLMRYGHAMAIPSPGIRTHAALAALVESRGRVRFAHSDLSGYSVFEEAFFHGDRAGRSIARESARRPRKRAVLR